MQTVLELLLLLLLPFVFTIASKCPEIRKPHVTSCVIYYDCINLPGGGYVWAPSKCADGLVFQPLLRLCVLPGDTWTCDDESDQLPMNNDHSTYHTSELIDKTKTSYDGLITDDMVYSVDVSHKIDSSSNLGNTLKTLPYPLIEIDEKLNNDKKHDMNSYPLLTSVKRLGNDLSRENNGEEYIPITVIKFKDKENDRIPNHKLFINRIFLYQQFAPLLKQHTLFSSPFIDYSTVTNNQRIGNDIMNYLIENYIFNRNLDNLKPINKNEIIMKMEATTERVENNLEESNLISITEKNKIDVKNIDELNNVLAIIGNLGRKEYITIEKYKSWSNEVNIEILEVIPCKRAQRLSNFTDCMRYYTCDPTSAEIHEFVCPFNTAFNNQTNLCDTQKYKTCKDSMQSRKHPSIMKLQKIISSNEFKDREKETLPATIKLCKTTGKFPDVTSDKFYYLCYSSSSSAKIESFRMACPNDLVFCQDSKICTSKQLCNNYN